MNKPLKVLTNGILKENPILVLVLGTCPTLAVTTMAFNGLGMGLAATFVLVFSNIVISLLRKIIPGQVRIPAYITVIATFVTIVQMLVAAFVPDLNKSLGVFLPLIVVNCIILGRAEMFASKNNVFYSALDGVGMGIGFTIILFLMGSIREILGAGTFMGMQILPEFVQPTGILITPPGGFFIFGVMMALAALLDRQMNKGTGKKPKKSGCGSCPAGANCPAKGECE